ncbi:MAG: ABC transporter permease [Ignavibacteria bacterium]|nr:ABC transporter permease [Ignavibacteria bacterium]MBT8381867.1 ABC transporter permease [Ignavibacteria bacterium]MBT8393197.1 ABC transporter permease [Ignavibacteria bacterium]NNJ52389.1 ABC transporter permease [Ignavibacteriaceae bacterium]NNL21831.1 ABC transporter permease [Ignavibacteriaceae bacterium]
MLKRIFAIVKKEVRQLKRDVRLLAVIFSFPVILLIMFGYAVNFDVKNIKIAVYNQDGGKLSRDFIKTLINSEYFNLVGMINSNDVANKYLDQKTAQCIVVIPNEFSKKINSNQNTSIQYLIDGVDANTASIIQNYMFGATAQFNKKVTTEFLARNGLKEFTPLSIETQFWFNPDLKTTRYLIPGLIAMILIVTAVITVALSFVREKEKGTMEQLNVSSLKTIELIIGKTFPFVVIALVNAGLILLAGYLIFGVEMKGSYLLLLLTTLIFLTASTSLGIFISVVSDSQQVAFTAATFISLLPSLILSGFVFPIDSMPFVIQIITNITPAKFFIEILRAIILRGVGVAAFWDQIIYLLIFIFVLIVLASIIGKRKAEAA